MLNSLQRQLEHQRRETAALGVSLLSHLPQLLEEMNDACIQEQESLRARREKLMVLLTDAYADCERKKTKNIVLIGDCLESEVLRRVEVSPSARAKTIIRESLRG